MVKGLGFKEQCGLARVKIRQIRVCGNLGSIGKHDSGRARQELSAFVHVRDKVLMVRGGTNQNSELVFLQLKLTEVHIFIGHEYRVVSTPDSLNSHDGLGYFYRVKKGLEARVV